MPILETIPILDQADIVMVRQKVRAQTVALGFGLVDQTKIVTAASELARNTLDYGGGGSVTLEVLESDQRVGLSLKFTDEGAGIANIELALQNGYTTGSGLGLGLGGAKRLMHEFEITSEVGKGTCITTVRWRQGI